MGTGRRTYLAWLKESILSEHVGTYCAYLSERGYSPNTTWFYISSIAHFSHWLSGRHLKLADISEKSVQQFITKHLPVCRCAPRCEHTVVSVRAALRHLLRVLRNEHRIPPAVGALPPAIQEEVDKFDDHLEKVCGLRGTTRLYRRHYVGRFLAYVFRRRPVNISHMKPHDVRQFVIHTGDGCTRGSIQVIATCVRSYLRFRAFCGDNTQRLLAAVPSVPQWRLASLPKALTDAELKQFLSAFDRTTPRGLRDYTMARCLVDLGMRSAEVAALRLENIDWREGILTLVGSKGGRATVLPLPAGTGRALVEYLRHGRPQSTSRALFLRHLAPLDRPLNSGIVRYAMRCAYRRSGVSKPWTGTYCLRHSVACRLLNAGSSLKEIADVLRHKSLDTTTIYAKVDRKQLGSVAMPWPGRRS